ncbi:TetR/AcrR family transcriptional regulator [Rhodococcus tibetensis]|uniref:TetR/AcrR family transcriptional regulator n=1 Tax=Rhodococcus tibetensis TaxID=2965064 RepID=A0ABT1QIK5_9NOCA|nr:TetR/AcrR family transcriptional regulator [Rhodococcus sp. FXJ9.536]MCQ4122090.1 TetR/AcrR family transcriptional regulator [Rhodococcus sp. FXJ9.536]
MTGPTRLIEEGVTSDAKKKVPTRGAQLRFLDGGLDVLGSKGHAGLRLATVCEAVGATTGSFYHAFANWGDYTSELIQYWRTEKSGRLISNAREITDPAKRLTFLIDIGLHLPHESEAAIRVWAAHDPDVQAIQIEVDQERRRFIADAYFEATNDRELAERNATVAMYLLVGYESGSFHSREALAWAFQTFVDQSLS